MRYRSNISAPDLAPHFKITEFDHFGGHTFLADPDFEPRCGFFTHDEAAILYHIACAVTRVAGGRPTWLDIGARTGWTAAHLIAAGAAVVALEPEFYRYEFMERTNANLKGVREQYAKGVDDIFLPVAMRSAEFFAMDTGYRPKYDGFIIDGNHDEPEPLRDAIGAAERAKENAIVVIHDFLGPATWQAADFLLTRGWHGKLYYTPNMMAVCWRGFGDSIAPFHRMDPIFHSYRRRVAEGFDPSRCV